MGKFQATAGSVACADRVLCSPVHPDTVPLDRTSQSVCGDCPADVLWDRVGETNYYFCNASRTLTPQNGGSVSTATFTLLIGLIAFLAIVVL